MGCFVVPLVATIVIGLRRKTSHKKKTVEGFWLSIMMAGASIFGLIDHAWNGELFMLSSNLVADISLGFTITTGVFIGWLFIVHRERLSGHLPFIERKTGLYK
ncbi:MAG: hypothetical protein KAS04_00030 [Candidatus Aenigmarchaeota archaeon]|nr:hypothetical protein [Candidatus Aenigmarchaeota archaeon]